MSTENWFDIRPSPDGIAWQANPRSALQLKYNESPNIQILECVKQGGCKICYGERQVTEPTSSHKAAVHVPDFDALVPAPELSLADVKNIFFLEI